MDYTELIEQYQELNMANYNEDEVCDLNAWGVKAVTAIEALQARVTELTAESETFSKSYGLLVTERDAALTRVTELEKVWGEDLIRGSEDRTLKLRALAERDAALAKLEALEKQAPVAWTLTEELTKRETTTRAHLWFTNPVNCMWSPLYASPVPAKTLTYDFIKQVVRLKQPDLSEDSEAFKDECCECAYWLKAAALKGGDKC